MRKLRKPLALLLTLVTLLSIAAPAGATSIGDGSKTVTVATNERHEYLKTTAGNTIGGSFYEYTTNDGIKGPAFCINHGLRTTTKSLTITGRYTSSPQTMGAFANGYPQRPLAQFLDVNQANHPALAGLTESEYGYATQLAVWSSLGQLAVEGTGFTAGRATIVKPTGDAQQVRVYTALTIILKNAEHWTKPLYTGMYIRAENNEMGNTVDLPKDMTLETAAQRSLFGIKQETINGTEYYTRRFTAASATSTYPNDYKINLWAKDAPAGTIFTDLNNTPLPTSSEGAYQVPTTERSTSLNANGSEHYGEFKLCLPVSNVAATGAVEIVMGADVTQFDIYLAHNPTAGEQSYIIADPGISTKYANGFLKWSSDAGDGSGSIVVTKVDGTGNALEGAVFALEASDGSTKTGTSDINGQVTWTDLDPSLKYTLRETQAPLGFSVVGPVTVAVTADQTSYVTVRNDTEPQLYLRKLDAQNGYALHGATFLFEQIDSSFKTTVTTGYDGLIQFDGKSLPFGSYRVSEQQSPEGYWPDPEPQTIHWTGETNVTLTFENTRKPGFTIIKVDADTGVSLPGASFRIYKDGKAVTDVQVDDNGCAYINGLGEGYFEVEELVSPSGYELDATRHGIHVNPYDPATEDDPVLIIPNKAESTLLILKYDAKTGQPVPGVTFEIYRNTQLVGSYVTNQQGEIQIPAAPGVYLVREIAAGEHHVVNCMPQEIEIKAGDGSKQLVFLNDPKPGIRIVKLDSETMQPLAGARFRVSQIGGTFTQEYVSNATGEIDLTDLDPSAYLVEELSAPDTHLVGDNSSRTIRIEGGGRGEFVFLNTRKPTLTIIKTDSQTGEPLSGARFEVKEADGQALPGSPYVSGAVGKVVIPLMEPMKLQITEISAPNNYIIDDPQPRIITVEAGKDVTVSFTDTKKPGLTIHKVDSITGSPVKGALFQIWGAVNGSLSGELRDLGKFYSDENGQISLPDQEVGWVRVQELEPASGYAIKDPSSQDVFLEAGKDKTVTFENVPLSALVLRKIDSETGLPVQGAAFRISYLGGTSGSGGTVIFDGVTNTAGSIILTGLKAGTYIAEEYRAAPGYELSNPSTKTAYLSGKDQDVVELVFENAHKGGLVIKKLDSVTKQPLAGVTFKVTDSSGGVIGPDNGEYTTDAEGLINIGEDLPIGSTVIVQEIKTPDTHTLDTTAQSVKIKENTLHSLTFYNTPKGGLIIKKLDSVTNQPLANVVFKVAYSDGRLIGPNDGRYTSDASGLIHIGELLDIGATVLVEEISCPDTHILDTQVQKVVIKANTTHELVFYNTPKGGLQILKLDEETRRPIAGVEFRVARMNGEIIGAYRTDSRGIIHLPDIGSGWFTATETKNAKGYILDDTVHSIEVTDGKAAVLTITNKKASGILIHKVDSVTGEGIPGVTFLLYDGSNNPLGQYESDQDGYVYIGYDGGLPEGKYKIRELQPGKGYIG
ncbi:Cys-Gln thioester bond-forming surface protein, partial [Oscillospiraceae bacterium OttesenSCG-928-G22]|nr:Cys-Gln thioester bond-forming surface protein [Oscillospiraceae bacterium OttesenSCG-928-G22]